MEFQTARQIYRRLQEAQQGPLKSLYDDFLVAATRYARIRSEWALADPEERADMDRERRTAHDRFIDACNILSRNMAKADLDASWRKRLGQNRKEIGDFACYVHCFLGLSAR